MVLDEDGLSVLWERVRDYVDAYVTEYDSLAVATESVRGQVRPDGTTITIDADGTIHGAASVPVATTSTPGTVRPDGTTITVDQDGVISATVVTGGPRLAIREDTDGRRRLAIVIPEE